MRCHLHLSSLVALGEYLDPASPTLILSRQTSKVPVAERGGFGGEGQQGTTGGEGMTLEEWEEEEGAYVAPSPG